MYCEFDYNQLMLIEQALHYYEMYVDDDEEEQKAKDLKVYMSDNWLL